MHTLRLTAITVLTVSISGCPVPMVRYEVVDATKSDYSRVSQRPDLEGWPKFKLASSNITLRAEVKDNRTDLKIASMPVEEKKNVTYYLVDATSVGIKSNLKIKNKDNSMLLESVTTQLEDNRVKLIQGIGGIVGSLVGVKVAGDVRGLPDDFAASIDVRAYFEANQPQDQEIALNDADVKTYKSASKTPFTVESLKISPPPADATLRSSFPIAIDQRTLIYSACRTASIKVSVQEASYEGTVKVADPNFVQTIALPPKGAITMHSECGISVTSEPVETKSATDLFQEILKQIKNVTGK